MYCVYKHTCPNGKVYIGITMQNPLHRWNGGRGYAGTYFHNAILKYGWDNIRHEILLDGLTKEEACESEVALIAKHKSNDRRFGYNRSAGGEFSNYGASMADETRAKLSKALKGRTPHNKGVPCSQKQKEKISHSLAGRYCYDDHPLARAVLQFSKNGDFIAEFSCIKEGSEKTAVNAHNITTCCKGGRKTAGGFVWRYRNEGRANGE